jgi:hypothetical protein
VMSRRNFARFGCGVTVRVVPELTEHPGARGPATLPYHRRIRTRPSTTGFDACIVVPLCNALNDSVQVAGQTQRQAKAGVVVMVKLVFPNITAGVAIAGTGIWLATAHGVAAIAAPPIQLASMDAVLAPPLGPAINPACGGLVGPSFAPPIPPKLAAALISAASTAADPAPTGEHTS